MENQHKQIKGYRDLTQEEIDLMNEGKELAEKCGDYIMKLQNLSVPVPEGSAEIEADKRWISIAQTHLQQGFMAAIRSVARPTTF